MKGRLPLTVVAVVSVVTICSLPAFAKKWTITERLEKISREIDEGRSANELTVKQVDGLKKDVAGVKATIEKMKAKNAGKLSIPDTNKIHKQLNEISVKTLQKRLDNVYKG